MRFAVSASGRLLQNRFPAAGGCFSAACECSASNTSLLMIQWLMGRGLLTPQQCVFRLTARPGALRLKPQTGSFAEASITAVARRVCRTTLARLLKNPHLLRYAHPSSLQRTHMYASFLRISRALHLDVFEQPVKSFNKLLIFISMEVQQCNELLWRAV